MEKTLILEFGCLCNPLKAQLRKQGITLDVDTIKHFQQDADAISRLSIRSIITDAEAMKARGRLVKIIARQIRKKVNT